MTTSIDPQTTHLVKSGYLQALAAIGYYAGCHEYGGDYNGDNKNSEPRFEYLFKWAQEFHDTWLQTDNNSFEYDVQTFTLKKMTRPYLVQLHKTITVRIEATSKDDALEKADNRYHNDDEQDWVHAETNAKVIP